MFSIEPFELFARLCADFLAYSYSFNAIFADAISVNYGHIYSWPINHLVMAWFGLKDLESELQT